MFFVHYMKDTKYIVQPPIRTFIWFSFKLHIRWSLLFLFWLLAKALVTAELLLQLCDFLLWRDRQFFLSHPRTTNGYLEKSFYFLLETHSAVLTFPGKGATTIGEIDFLKFSMSIEQPIEHSFRMAVRKTYLTSITSVIVLWNWDWILENMAILTAQDVPHNWNPYMRVGFIVELSSDFLLKSTSNWYI